MLILTFICSMLKSGSVKQPRAPTVNDADDDVDDDEIDVQHDGDATTVR